MDVIVLGLEPAAARSNRAAMRGVRGADPLPKQAQVALEARL